MLGIVLARMTSMLSWSFLEGAGAMIVITK